MADQTKFFFDVWLTHAGTVYRSVRFGVVTDWIQQGRLLVDDCTPPKDTVRVEIHDKDRKKNTFLDLTKEKALEKINEICQNQVVPEVIVAAHQQLLFEQLRELSVELEKQKAQQRIGRIRIEVSEKRK